MESQSRRQEHALDRESRRSPLRVAVVADAGLELTPEQIAELRIAVVPRELSIGRRRRRLDADFTAASLAMEERRPRKVTWRPQEVGVTQEVYARQAGSGGTVFAFHPPVALDGGTRQARRARNFLWPAPVQLVELPLLGMGQARVIDLVARFAALGVDSATLLSLTQSIATLVKTLVIVPSRARTDRFVDASGTPPGARAGLFRNPHLLCEIRSEDGRLQILDAHEDLAVFSEKIGRYIAHMGTRGVPLLLTWRAARYDKHLDGWRLALDQRRIAQESTNGWSPHVTANLGSRWIEVCLAPSHKELVNLARQYQQRLERIRQTTGARQPWRRLSDYEIDIH